MLVSASLTLACGAPSGGVSDVEWPLFAGDEGGSRMSTASQITPSNVSLLEIAWQARLDSVPVELNCLDCSSARVRAESTPVMFGGMLFVATPRGSAIAFDARTGKRLWTFRSGLDTSLRYKEGLTTRGLAVWRDSLALAGTECSVRVFLATVGSFLYALDAYTGNTCVGFGENGRVNLTKNIALTETQVGPQDHSVTSPPILGGGVVLVGSTVDGHLASPTISGALQAFDARSGELKWTFDAIPRSPVHSARNDWPTTAGQAVRGGGNSWAPISFDAELGLFFIPTASASPTHIGISRPGNNAHANSVLAVEARSGSLRWAFQLVKHDLWDYDVATQPLVVSLELNGSRRRVVVASSKAGGLFILDAATGEQLTDSRAVSAPRSGIRNEVVSRRQSLGLASDILGMGTLTRDSMFGLTPADLGDCREAFGALRYDGQFTPPSVEGSVLWPGVWGGPNWDGFAYDSLRGLLVVPIRRIASVVQLQPKLALPPNGPPTRPGEQRFWSASRDFLVRRWPLVATSGVPCTPPPWGALVAIRLPSGRKAWTQPLGDLAVGYAGRAGRERGTLLFGGASVSATGLTFIAATQDDSIRALETASGRILWSRALPAGGQATPITYMVGGVQYVAIVAGGRAGIGTPGDFIVAYSLRGKRAPVP